MNNKYLVDEYGRFAIYINKVFKNASVTTRIFRLHRLILDALNIDLHPDTCDYLIKVLH